MESIRRSRYLTVQCDSSPSLDLPNDAPHYQNIAKLLTLLYISIALHRTDVSHSIRTLQCDYTVWIPEIGIETHSTQTAIQDSTTQPRADYRKRRKFKCLSIIFVCINIYIYIYIYMTKQSVCGWQYIRSPMWVELSGEGSVIAPRSSLLRSGSTL